MPCTTCHHTMESIVNVGSVSGWWCPRCGTCKMVVGTGTEEVYVPKLVARTREFVDFLKPSLTAIHQAKRLGIQESVGMPQ